MRLNVYLARAGVCSRRRADALIKEGRIQVNGQTVSQPYLDVKAGDQVQLNGKPVSLKKPVYLALNKPVGYTCTLKDRFAEQKVTDLIPKHFGKVFPAGRLDKDSSGLVILTNDGDFTQHITHPSFQAEKEYEVTVVPSFRDRDTGVLTGGITDSGEKLRAASVRTIGNFSGKSVLSVVMKEGKKREIRRMFSHLHYHILSLKRIRIGQVSLAGLPVGKFRHLTEKEIKSTLNPTPAVKRNTAIPAITPAVKRNTAGVILSEILAGIILSLGIAGKTPASDASVRLGIEVLIEKKSDLIKGKKVGLVTNLTGVDSRLRSSADLIYSLPGVKLIALYGPEHGIRGGTMDPVASSRDEKTGVPVYSLYGATRRPTREMLKDVEILLFDIQDIGTRSYTYISTMKLCMEEAARHKIKFLVLDRPNPINGLLMDGPVLDMKFESFISAGPLPYVHGMTIGEIAKFFNEELKINCNLQVIPMEGWKRVMAWKDTGLVWIPTSPHIPESDTPWFYPITGILGELPLVSVGVGYTLPFKIVGATWLDGEKISGLLNSRKIPGVYFQPFSFTPFYHHFQGEFCGGFKIIITDQHAFKPVATGYHIMELLLKTYPDKFNFSLVPAGSIKMFDNANGTDTIRRVLEQGLPAEKIIQSYQPGLAEFLKKREKYLLYK